MLTPEQNKDVREVREEVHKAIESSMKLRLRPYPKMWEKSIRGQKFVDQYRKMLTPEQNKDVDELLLLYKDRIRLLDRVTRDNYWDYGSVSGKIK